MLKPLKCLYLKHFNGFSTFRISLDCTKIQSKIHTFSDASFRMSFFEILVRLGANKTRFWEPLGAQLGPKWRPKSPKWRQNGIIFIFPRSPFCRLASDVTFGALLGIILVDLGSIFHWNLMICSHCPAAFWYSILR